MFAANNLCQYEIIKTKKKKNTNSSTSWKSTIMSTVVKQSVEMITIIVTEHVQNKQKQKHLSWNFQAEVCEILFKPPPPQTNKKTQTKKNHPINKISTICNFKKVKKVTLTTAWYLGPPIEGFGTKVNFQIL